MDAQVLSALVSSTFNVQLHPLRESLLNSGIQIQVVEGIHLDEINEQADNSFSAFL